MSNLKKTVRHVNWLKGKINDLTGLSQLRQ